MQIPPTCALDEAGIRDQKARYAQLASAVTSVRRDPDALVIDFDGRLDVETLEQAIAVECECCPFFRFAFDDQARRLRVTVAADAMRPALDAISDALA